MEEYTDVIINDDTEDTDEEKSFGRAIAEALAIGFVTGIGTLASFAVLGWAEGKFEAWRERRAAKKAASDVVEEMIEELATDTNEEE